MGNFSAYVQRKAPYKKTGILNSIKNYLSQNRLGDLLLSKGLICESMLQQALCLQHIENKPLGQVLIAQKSISRTQLGTILARQHLLRSIAALLFFSFTLIGFSGGKKAKADMIKDIPAQIALNVKGDFNRMAVYPRLFGSSEKKSYSLKAFTKWSGMFERFDRSMQYASSQTTVKKWKAAFSSYQNGSIKAMAEKVNIAMNKKRYITDDKNWGKSDYWATPIEFLERGGDCEDFAIAKYTALRALGVPEDRLRLAIVQDLKKNIPHAVLIVYTEDGPYALDNQIKTLIDADNMTRYKPIFSINRTAWWLHTMPNGTQYASAN